MSRSILFALSVGLLIAAAPPPSQNQLDGHWVMVRGEMEGKPLSRDVIKHASLVISGDHHTVQVGDDHFVGTHHIDPTQNPKTIDSMDTEGRFKGETIKGIYRLSRNEFAVCFAPPGKDRPTEFTTLSGTGVIHHVWKRAKK